MVDVNDIQVQMLNNDEYIHLMSEINGNASIDDIKDDFAFSVSAGDKHFIIIRDAIEMFPPYVHKAIVAHELAHIHGIKDEEEADIWALRYLDDSLSKRFLTSNWEIRHGHKYEYDEVDDYPVYVRS